MAPAVGEPVGFEIPATNVARACEFYKAAFNWSIKPSHFGIPEHKLMVFEVPGPSFPQGGVIKLVDMVASAGSGRLFLCVDDVASALANIENLGGKKTGEVMAEGSIGFFQNAQDTEGNPIAIYAYAK